MKFKSNIGVQAGIEDNNDLTGDSGQILSSTGSGVAWIDQNAIGASTDFVFFNVKNETGSTILKGKGVMAVGTDGNSGHILIDEMVADGTIESKYFLGVLEEDIPNGGFARVISFGQLSQFNTSGQNGETWADGQVLWCDPVNPGDFTITEPDGPNVKIAAAFIINSSTNGKIQVRVQANEGIHDLHDTKITSQVDGDVLVWDNTTGVWFNDSTLNVDYTNSRVGIGTTDPGQDLEISGQGNVAIRLTSTDSTTSTLQFADSDDVNVGMIQYHHGSNYMSFKTNDDERMRITSTGNVGIGTTDPSQKLDVNGIVNIDGTLFVNTTNNHIRLVDTDNTGNFSVGVNTNFQIRDITANTTPLTIRAGTPSDTILTTASGRVGIGLNSPGTTLHVDGFVRINGGLQMNATNATIYQILDSALRFGTNNTERMRISSTGNVGIGTTDPSQKLTIRDDSTTVYSTGDAGTNTGDLVLQNNDETDNNFNRISFQSNSDNNQTGDLLDAARITAIYPDHAGSNPSGELAFETKADAGNMAEAMRIDRDGKVGIGTTDPGAKLHVDGDVLIKSGEYISWGTVGSTSIEGSTVSNKLQFRTNSSDRMIINSSGNVGIGTTSPSEKLNISGNILATGTILGSNLSGTNTGDQDLSGYLRSDANDETGSGIKTWFGGALNSGSGATIQVNGFQRTGNIYLHSGGNSPDNTRDSDYLSNINGDLHWNKHDVGNGKVWTSVNDGEDSGLDADTLDGQHGTHYLDYSNFTSTPTIPTDFVSAANGGTFGNALAINHSAFTGLTLTRSTANGSNIDFNNSEGLLGRIGYLSNGSLAITNETIGTSNMMLLTSGGNATFAGDLTASNFSGTSSGTNTGDQDLSGYALIDHNHDSDYFKILRGYISLTGSNPFDDAKTETQVTGSGSYLISYTGASAHLISSNVGGSASMFQIGAHYNGDDFYMRTRTDSSSWQTWKKLWHNGNLDPSDFATSSHNHDGTYLPLTAGSSHPLTGALHFGDAFNYIEKNANSDMLIVANRHIIFSDVISGVVNERMRIKEGGNVGIGTTNPQYALDVDRDTEGVATDNSGIRVRAYRPHLNLIDRSDYTDSNGHNFQIKADSAKLQFNATSADDETFDLTRMVIDKDGNVGIGTDNPNDKLDVTDGNSKMVFGSASSDRPLLYFQHNAVPVDKEEVGLLDFRGYNDASQDTRYVILTAKAEDVTDGSEDGSLTFQTMKAGTATQTMTLRSGSVGIGTTSPSRALHVSDSSDAPFRVESTDSTTGIQFKDPDGNNNIYYVGNGDYFYTSAKVGIGTTNPGQKLSIRDSVNNGDVGIDIYNAYDDNLETSNPNAVVWLSAASNNGYLRVHGAPANTASKHQIDLGSTAGSSFLTFSPSGSERMRIASNGNVGIGTTDPDYPLHISSTLGYPVLIERTNSRDAGIRFKDSFTTSADSVRIGADGDDFKILTSNSERFRINESGNVQLNSYGSGTITGTTAYNLAVDSSGNIIENSANTRSIFVATSTDTTTNINATTTIQWNSENIKDSGYTHSDTTNPEQITITQTGTYKIYAAITYNTTVQRANVAVEILVNDVATGTRGAGGYVRSVSSHNDGTTIVEDYITVSANDVIKIQTSQEAESGTVNLRSGESKIIIEKLTGLTLSTTDANTLGGLGAADFVAVTGDTMTGALSINEGGATIKKTNSLSKQTVLTVQELADEGSQQTLVLKNTNNRDVGIKFETAGGINYIWQDSGDGIDDALIFSTGGENRTNDAALILHQNQEVIIPNGNVGIGTDSPDSKLHIYASDSGATAYQSGNDGLIVERGGRASINLLSPTTNDSYLFFGNPTAGNAGYVGYQNTENRLVVKSSDYISLLDSTGEVVRVDNGNVGIGTTNAENKLHVQQSGIYTGIQTTAGIRIKSDGASVNGSYHGTIALSRGTGSVAISAVQEDTDSDVMGLAFFTHPSATGGDAAVEKMRIDHDGNVGIGTIEPTQKLHVDGNLKTDGNFYLNPSSTQVTMSGNTSGNFTIDNNTGQIAFQTNGSTVNSMTITSSQITLNEISQVNNTLRTLTAMGDTAQWDSAALRLESTDTINTTGFQGLRFATSTANYYGWRVGANRRDSGRGSLRFYEHTGAATGIERFTIAEGGNVGIGTDDPTSNLHIAGNGDQWLFVNSLDGNTSGIRLQTSDSTRQNVLYRDSTSNLLTLRNGMDNGEISFIAGGSTAERMRIDSAGNVGIGTTVPTAKLHLEGDAIIEGVLRADNVNLGLGGAIKLKASNTASDQYIAFGTTPSGSNGNATFTEKMRITSGGNVGIGETNPDEKLEVSGSFKIGNIKIQDAVTGRIGLNRNTSTGAIYNSNYSAYQINGPTTSTGSLDIQSYSSTGSYLGVVSINSGNVTANNFILSSDETLKENVKDLDVKVDAKWRSYKFKDSEETRYGVIAQELEETNPELVRTNDEGLKSVAYVDLLIAKIAELEARLEKAGL